MSNIFFLFVEKEYSICDIPRKTDCDAVTTACMVTDGAYYCVCKKGYMKTEQIKRDSSKFCKGESVVFIARWVCLNVEIATP